MWNEPPVLSAMACSVGSSAGTRCVSPSMVTVPFCVPNAIVETCTCAFLAAATAVATDRPTVFVPSLSSTMRAGGGLSPAPSSTW